MTPNAATRRTGQALLAALAVAMLAGAGEGAIELAPRLGVPAAARWIWYPEGKPARSAPAQSRYFRATVDLGAGEAIERAWWIYTGDDSASAWVNATALGRKQGGWNRFQSFDVTRLLRPGRNVLAVEVQNGTGPAGLLGWLCVRRGGKTQVIAPTEGAWKASREGPPGWTRPAFDDSAWPAARVLGPMGIAPWGHDIDGPGGVAPDVPAREATGSVSPEQARKLIEADWIVQAFGQPTPHRSLREIAWARSLADRLAKMKGAAAGEVFAAELAELDRLEARLKALGADEESEAATELYLAVRRVKRAVTFRNPLLDFDKLLLADTPAYAGKHESAHRNGYHYGSRGGSRLVVLEGLRPDGRERDLLAADAGYLMRMDLSFEADRVVFSLKPPDQPSFRLYEIGVDGRGLRQLTNSPYDDMDPIYLPDGHILFSTSRGHTYVRCLPPSASTVLARCDGDGRNIVILSRNNEPDYTPALTNDGRVLYTRWEYTERPLWRLQKLWTINPDGTGEAVYWGNSSQYPDMLWEARQSPRSGRVFFAGVGHHDVMTGVIGVLDVDRGREWPEGIAKVTAELRWTEIGDDGANNPIASGDYHQAGPAWSYRCPWPLGEEDFLVSAARTPKDPFLLYVMDVHGNRELIYAGRHDAWYARPLRARARPPIVPERVTWPRAGEPAGSGVLFSPNVYAGTTLPPGKAKFLRVIQMDSKTYTTPYKSWRHSGPAISIIQEDGVKRILGTAPIQSDGSVAFEAPAGAALHFQLLDADQRCLQLMRSFTGVMPGETRGCLGCHSLHSVSPQPAQALALRRAPSKLTPPPWGANVSISYERFCQPVLDKHCGRCHQGKGKGRAKLDLTLRGGVAERGIEDPALLPFKEPYLTLVGQAWGGPKPAGKGAALGLAGCLNVEVHHRYGPLEPMTMLSSTSRLIRWVTDGKHNNIRIEGEDLLRLIAWVDCNCVYRGDEEVRKIPDPPAGSRYPVPMVTRSAPVVDRLQPVNDPR